MKTVLQKLIGASARAGVVYGVCCIALVGMLFGFPSTAHAATLTEIVDMKTLIGGADLGTGVTNESASYVEGNTVYNFTGEGSIYDLTHEQLSSIVTAKTEILVVAAWVKPTAASVMSIFSTGGQCNGFKFDLTVNGLQCTTKGVADKSDDYTIARDGSTWTLVALSLPLSGSGDGRLHITPTNGQHLTRSFGGMNDANPATFGIGTGDSNSDRECFQGAIANLKVFTANAVPSNSEIAMKVPMPMTPAPENSGIIGINFADGRATLDGTTGNLGFKSGDKGGEIAVSQWNRLLGQSGNTTVKDVNNNTYYITFSAPTTWSSGSTGTAIEKLTYGYLDSSSGSGVVSVSLSALPTTGYDVALICGGDGGTFAPFTVNDMQYTALNGATIVGGTGWGTRAGASELTEGTNVLYIPAQKASTLTIVGSNTGGRGTLAGLMIFPKEILPDRATATIDTTYSALTWVDGTEPTASDVAQITLDDGVTLTIDKTVAAGTLEILCEGSCTIALTANGSFGTTIVNYDGVTGMVTYGYNVSTVSPSDKILYDGGAGSTTTAAVINMSGGTIALTGGNFYLPETCGASGTATTVNQSGDTKVITANFALGTATWNLTESAKMTATRFILSEGANGRAATFNLDDDAAVTVTGREHESKNADSNQADIMFGHWNGPSTFTIWDTATFTAIDSDVLVGKTGNNQTINIEGGTVNVRGIKVSGNGVGTNTLNLSGGELKLGETGIGVYANSITTSVTGNAKITSTAPMTLSQPIVLNEGSVLTLDASGGTITVTGAVSGTGAIKIEGSGMVDLSALATNPTIAGVATGATLNVASEAGAMSLLISGGSPSATVPVTDGAVIDGTLLVDGEDATGTVDDGVMTVASNTVITGNPKLTGSDWLWDYEFNGSNASIGSDTGTVTLEGSATSYTPAEEDGNQALYFQKTPWRDTTYATEYTAVMRCMPGEYANTVLIAFGSSTAGSQNAVVLATGANPANGEMQLAFWNNSTSTLTPIGGTLVVPNATTAYHTYAFTLATVAGKTHITVYVDGKRKAIYEHDSVMTLGDGLQIGSIHGGVVGGLSKYAGSGDSGSLDWLRTTNSVLSAAAIQAIANAYPYVSAKGDASRTVTASDTMWVSPNAWVQQTVGAQPAEQNKPNDDTNVVLTVEADTALTFNVDTAPNYESVTIEGDGALTLKGDKVEVFLSDLTTRTDLTLDAKMISVGALLVGEGATVTLDVDALVKETMATRTIPVINAATLEAGAQITLKEIADTARTVTLNNQNGAYSVTIAVPETGLMGTVSADTDWTKIAWEANTSGVDAKVVLDATADATVTLDINQTVESLWVKGTGALTLTGLPLTVTDRVTVAGTLLTDETLNATKVTVDGTLTLAVTNEHTLHQVSGTGSLIKTGDGVLKLQVVEAGALAENVRIEVQAGRLATFLADGVSDPILKNVTLAFTDSGAAFASYGWINIDGELTVDVAENVNVELVAEGAYVPSLTASAAEDAEEASLKKTGAGTFTFTLFGLQDDGTTQREYDLPMVTEAGTLAFKTDFDSSNMSAAITSTLSGAGGIRLSEGVLTLSTAHTYTGKTSIANGATLIVNGTEDGTNVLPDLGTTVAIVEVEQGGTIQLKKGTSWATLQGAGLVQVTGDYTFGLGGNGSKLIADNLTIDTGATLTAKAWSDNAIQAKNLTIQGTLAGGQGGQDPTLLVPANGTVKGAGTVAIATTFADGAILDATALSDEVLPLTLSGTFTQAEGGTLKIAITEAQRMQLEDAAANNRVASLRVLTTANEPTLGKVAIVENGMLKNTLTATTTPPEGETNPGLFVTVRSKEDFNYWTNKVDNLWSTEGNWTAGRTPTEAEAAYISTAMARTLTMGADATVAELTLEGAGILAIDGTHRLTVGTLNVALSEVTTSSKNLSFTSAQLAPGSTLIVDVPAGEEWKMGTLAGAGRLVKTGAGTMLFEKGTATDALAEATIEVREGALILASAETTPTPLVLNGVTLRFERDTSVETNVAIELQETVTVEFPVAGETLRWDVTQGVAGAGSLRKTGDGNLRLMNGTVEGVGACNIVGGQLHLANMTLARPLQGSGSLVIDREPLATSQVVVLSADNGTYGQAIEIREGTTVTLGHANALGAGVKSGAGTIDIPAAAMTAIPNANGLNAATWTGAVRLATLFNGLNLASFGNAASSIELTGDFTGYLAMDTWTCEAEFILNGTLTLNNGSSNQTHTYRKLSGSGTLAADGTTVADTIHVKDATNFKGSVDLKSTSSRCFIFGEESVARANQKVFITKGAPIVIAEDKTWSAADGITVCNGGLIGGAGTVTSNLIVQDNGGIYLTETPLTVSGTTSFGNILKIVTVAPVLNADGALNSDAFAGKTIVTLAEAPTVPTTTLATDTTGAGVPYLVVANGNTLVFGDALYTRTVDGETRWTSTGAWTAPDGTAADQPAADGAAFVTVGATGATLTVPLTTNYDYTNTTTPLVTVAKLTTAGGPMTLALDVTNLKYNRIPRGGLEISLLSALHLTEQVEIKVVGLNRFGATATINQTARGASVTLHLPTAFYPEVENPAATDLPDLSLVALYRATLSGEEKWSEIAWTDANGFSVEGAPTEGAMVELVLENDVTLTCEDEVIVGQLYFYGEGKRLALPNADLMKPVAWSFMDEAMVLEMTEPGVAVPSPMRAYPERIRYTYLYETETAYATTTQYETEFAAGYTGPSVSLVGGLVEFSSGAVTLASLEGGAVDTTLLLSNAVELSVSGDLRLSNNTLWMKDQAKLQTLKLVTGDFASNRTTTLLLENEARLEVTGSENGYSTTTSSLLISHWSSQTNITLRDQAQFVAEQAVAEMAWDGNTTCILEDNATFKVLGIAGRYNQNPIPVEVFLRGQSQFILGEEGIPLVTDQERAYRFSYEGGALVFTADETLSEAVMVRWTEVTGTPRFVTTGDATVTVTAVNAAYAEIETWQLEGKFRLDLADEGVLPTLIVPTASVVEVVQPVSARGLELQGGTVALNGGILTLDSYTATSGILQIPLVERIAESGYLLMGILPVRDLQNTTIKLVMDPNATSDSRVLQEILLCAGNAMVNEVKVKAFAFENNPGTVEVARVEYDKTGTLGPGLYVILTGDGVMVPYNLSVPAKGYDLFQSEINVRPYLTFTGAEAGATVNLPAGGVTIPYATFEGEAMTLTAKAESEPSVLLQGKGFTFATDVTFDLKPWSAALGTLARGAVRDVPASLCLVSGSLRVAEGVTFNVTNAPKLKSGFKGEVVATDEGIYYVISAERRTRTVSVNLTTSAYPLTVPPAQLGVYALPVAGWNTLTDSFSSAMVMLSDRSGVANHQAMDVADATIPMQIANYSTEVGTLATAPFSLLKAWLSDAAAQTVKISHLPFTHYRVALIFANDLEGAAYAPITINGQQYAMDEAYTRRNILGYRSPSTTLSATVDVAGDTQWGSTDLPTAVATLGHNALVSDVLTDATVEIQLPELVYKRLYAGLAAVQILEAPVAEELALTATYQYSFTAEDVAAGTVDFETLKLKVDGAETAWVNSATNSLSLVFPGYASNAMITLELPAGFEAKRITTEGAGRLTLKVKDQGGAALEEINAGSLKEIVVDFPATGLTFTPATGLTRFNAAFDNQGSNYVIAEGAILHLGETCGIVTNLDNNGTATLTIDVANSAGTLRRDYPVVQTNTVGNSTTTKLTLWDRDRIVSATTDNSGTHLLVAEGDTLHIRGNYHLQRGDEAPAPVPAWAYTQTGGEAKIGGNDGLLVFNNYSFENLTAKLAISGGRFETKKLMAWRAGAKVEGAISKTGVLAIGTEISRNVSNGAQWVKLDFTDEGTLEFLGTDCTAVELGDAGYIRFNGGRLYAPNGVNALTADLTIDSTAAAPTKIEVGENAKLKLVNPLLGSGYLRLTQGTLALEDEALLGSTTLTVAAGAILEKTITADTDAATETGTVILEAGAIVSVNAEVTLTNESPSYTAQIAGALQLADANAKVYFLLNGEAYAVATGSTQFAGGQVIFEKSQKQTVAAAYWKSSLANGTWKNEDSSVWVSAASGETAVVYRNGAAVTFGATAATLAASSVTVTTEGALAPASIAFTDANRPYHFVQSSESYLKLPGAAVGLGNRNVFDVPIETEGVNTTIGGTDPTVRLIGQLSADHKTASLVGSADLNADNAHGVWTSNDMGTITLAPKEGETQTLSPFGNHLMGDTIVNIVGEQKDGKPTGKGGTVNFAGNVPGTNWNAAFTGQFFIRDGATLDFTATRADNGSNAPYFRVTGEGDAPVVAWTEGRPIFTLMNGATLKFGPQFRGAVASYDQRTNQDFLESVPFVIGTNSNIRFGFTNNNRQILTHGILMNGDGATITIGDSSRNWRGLYLTRGITLKVAGIGDECDPNDPNYDDDVNDEGEPVNPETYQKLKAGITARIVAEADRVGIVRWDEAGNTFAEGVTMDVGEGSTLALDANIIQSADASVTLPMIKTGAGRLTVNHSAIETKTQFIVEEGILGGSGTLTHAESTIQMDAGTTIEAGLTFGGTLTLESETTLAVDPSGRTLLHADYTAFMGEGPYMIQALEGSTLPSATGREPIKVISWMNAQGSSTARFELDATLEAQGFGVTVMDDGLYLMPSATYYRQLGDIQKPTGKLDLSLTYTWSAPGEWRRALDPASETMDYDADASEAVTALFLLPKALDDYEGLLTVRLILDKATTFSRIRFGSLIATTANGVTTYSVKPRNVSTLVYQYNLPASEMPVGTEAVNFSWVSSLMFDRPGATAWDGLQGTAVLMPSLPSEEYEYLVRNTTVVVYRAATAAAINLNFSNESDSGSSWIKTSEAICGQVPMAGVYWNNASPKKGSDRDELFDNGYALYSLSANVVGSDRLTETTVRYLAKEIATVSSRRGSGNAALMAGYLKGATTVPPTVATMDVDTAVAAGWQVKVDQVPFTSYDLYLYFAGADDAAANYPAVRIKVGTGDQAPWRVFSMRNDWVAPADATDLWTGIGGLVNGGFVSGANMLHVRIQANADQPIQIAPCDGALGNGAGNSGLAALQIVECDGAAYIRQGTGAWSDTSGWRVVAADGSSSNGLWQDATIEAPHFASVTNVSVLDADTPAAMPWLEIGGSSDMTLTGYENALDLGALDFHALEAATVTIENALFTESPNVILAPEMTLRVPETLPTTENAWRWVYPTTAAQTSVLNKRSANDLVLMEPILSGLDIDEGTLWLHVAEGKDYTRNQPITGSGTLGKTGPGTLTINVVNLQNPAGTIARVNEGTLYLNRTANSRVPTGSTIVAEVAGTALLTGNGAIGEAAAPFEDGVLLARDGGTIHGQNMYRFFTKDDDGATSPMVRLENGRYLNELTVNDARHHLKTIVSSGFSFMDMTEGHTGWDRQSLNLHTGDMTVEEGELALHSRQADPDNYLRIHGMDYSLADGTTKHGGAIKVAAGAAFYSNYPICSRGTKDDSVLMKLGGGLWVQTCSPVNHEGYNGGNIAGGLHYNGPMDILEGTFRWNLGNAVHDPVPATEGGSCLITIHSGARMDGAGHLQKTKVMVEDGATLATGIPSSWTGIDPAHKWYADYPERFKAEPSNSIKKLKIDGGITFKSGATFEISIKDGNVTPLESAGPISVTGTLTVRLTDTPMALDATKKLQLTNFTGDVTTASVTLVCPEAATLNATLRFGDEDEDEDPKNLYLVPSSEAFVWANASGVWSSNTWTKDGVSAAYDYLRTALPVARLESVEANNSLTVDENKLNSKLRSEWWDADVLVFSADEDKTFTLNQGSADLTQPYSPLVHTAAWKLGAGDAVVKTPLTVFSPSTSLHVKEGTLRLAQPIQVREVINNVPVWTVPTEISIEAGATLHIALEGAQGTQKQQTLQGNRTGAGTLHLTEADTIVELAGDPAKNNVTTDNAWNYLVEAGTLILSGEATQQDRSQKRAITLGETATLELTSNAALGWSNFLQWTLAPGAMIVPTNNARVRGTMTIDGDGAVTLGSEMGRATLDGDLTLDLPVDTELTQLGTWTTPRDTTSGQIVKKGAGTWTIAGSYGANLPVTFEEGTTVVTRDVDISSDSADVTTDWVINKGAKLRFDTSTQPHDLGSSGTLRVTSGGILDVAASTLNLSAGVAEAPIVFENGARFQAGNGDARLGTMTFNATTRIEGTVYVELNVDVENFTTVQSTAVTLIDFEDVSRRLGSGRFQLSGATQMALMEAGWILRDNGGATVVLEPFAQDEAYTWANTTDTNWTEGAVWLDDQGTLTAWSDVLTSVARPSLIFGDQVTLPPATDPVDVQRTVNWNSTESQTLTSVRLETAEDDYVLQAMEGNASVKMNLLGDFIKMGTGKVTVDRPLQVSETGSFKVLGGTVELTRAFSGNMLESDPINTPLTISQGATLALATTSDVTLAGRIEGDGELHQKGRANLNLATDFNSLSAVKVQSGRVTLSAVNAYTFTSPFTLASEASLVYGGTLLEQGNIALSVNADTTPAGTFRWMAQAPTETLRVPRLVAPETVAKAYQVETFVYEPKGGHLILDADVLPETATLQMIAADADATALWVGAQPAPKGFNLGALTGQGRIAVEPVVDKTTAGAWATTRALTLNLTEDVTFGGSFVGATVGTDAITLGLTVANATDDATPRFTYTGQSTNKHLGSLTVKAGARADVVGLWNGAIVVEPGATLGGQETVGSVSHAVVVPKDATLCASAYGEYRDATGNLQSGDLPTDMIIPGSLELDQGSKLRVMVRRDAAGAPWVSHVMAEALVLPDMVDEGETVPLTVVLDIPEDLVPVSGVTILSWSTLSGLPIKASVVDTEGKSLDGEYAVVQQGNNLVLLRRGTRFLLIVQ